MLCLIGFTTPDTNSELQKKKKGYCKYISPLSTSIRQIVSIPTLNTYTANSCLRAGCSTRIEIKAEIKKLPKKYILYALCVKLSSVHCMATNKPPNIAAGNRVINYYIQIINVIP